jgi:hypothetical protein
VLNIRVGNIKMGDTGVYIGRPNGDRSDSPLANPYRLAREEDRAKVIARYREWLWKKIQAGDPKVMAELWRLLDLARRPEGVTLLCWCRGVNETKPACHGDIIKAALHWLNEQQEDELFQVARELGGVPIDYSTGEVLQW